MPVFQLQELLLIIMIVNSAVGNFFTNTPSLQITWVACALAGISVFEI